MKRIDTRNSDRMIFREPMYASWVVSIPLYFGLVGGGGYVAALILDALVNSENLEPNPLGILLLGFVGLFLTLAAVVKLFDWFARRGCTVDRETNTLRWEWGLFVLPLMTRTYSLRSYRRLEIHGIRWVGERTGSTHRTECYLDLCGPNGWRVRIGRAENKDSLVHMAYEIAAFADLEVVDEMYSPAQVRRRRGDVQPDDNADDNAIVNAVMRALAAKHGWTD